MASTSGTSYYTWAFNVSEYPLTVLAGERDLMPWPYVSSQYPTSLLSAIQTLISYEDPNEQYEQSVFAVLADVVAGSPQQYTYVFADGAADGGAPAPPPPAPSAPSSGRRRRSRSLLQQNGPTPTAIRNLEFRLRAVLKQLAIQPDGAPLPRLILQSNRQVISAIAIPQLNSLPTQPGNWNLILQPKSGAAPGVYTTIVRGQTLELTVDQKYVDYVSKVSRIIKFNFDITSTQAPEVVGQLLIADTVRFFYFIN